MKQTKSADLESVEPYLHASSAHSWRSA